MEEPEPPKSPKLSNIRKAGEPDIMGELKALRQDLKSMREGQMLFIGATFAMGAILGIAMFGNWAERRQKDNERLWKQWEKHMQEGKSK